MNYFLDTEFLEAGPSKPLSLLSIGIISDDEREFYAESTHQDLEEAVAINPWLGDNVMSQLIRQLGRGREEQLAVFRQKYPYAQGGVMQFDEIKSAVLKYIGDDPTPVFWGYFCDYDWVIFAQIFGRMVDLPSRFPRFCRDLKQDMVRLGVSKPEIPNSGHHNALSDARWTRSLYKYLLKKGLTGY